MKKILKFLRKNGVIIISKKLNSYIQVIECKKDNMSIKILHSYKNEKYCVKTKHSIYSSSFNQLEVKGFRKAIKTLEIYI